MIPCNVYSLLPKGNYSSEEPSTEVRKQRKSDRWESQMDQLANAYNAYQARLKSESEPFPEPTSSMGNSTIADHTLRIKTWDNSCTPIFFKFFQLAESRHLSSRNEKVPIHRLRLRRRPRHSKCCISSIRLPRQCAEETVNGIFVADTSRFPRASKKVVEGERAHGNEETV